MRRIVWIMAVLALAALNACMTGNPRVDNATQTGGAMAVNGAIAGAVIGMAFGMPPEAGAKIGGALGMTGGIAMGAADNRTPQRGERPAGTSLSFGERGVEVLNNYHEPVFIQIAGLGVLVGRIVMPDPLKAAGFPLYNIGGKTVRVTAFTVDQRGQLGQKLADINVSFQWGQCVGGGCADQGQRFLIFDGQFQ